MSKFGGKLHTNGQTGKAKTRQRVFNDTFTLWVQEHSKLALLLCKSFLK